MIRTEKKNGKNGGKSRKEIVLSWIVLPAAQNLDALAANNNETHRNESAGPRTSSSPWVSKLTHHIIATGKQGVKIRHYSIITGCLASF